MQSEIKYIVIVSKYQGWVSSRPGTLRRFNKLSLQWYVKLDGMAWQATARRFNVLMNTQRRSVLNKNQHANRNKKYLRLPWCFQQRTRTAVCKSSFGHGNTFFFGITLQIPRVVIPVVVWKPTCVALLTNWQKKITFLITSILKIKLAGKD